MGGNRLPGGGEISSLSKKPGSWEATDFQERGGGKISLLSLLRSACQTQKNIFYSIISMNWVFVFCPNETIPRRPTSIRRYQCASAANDSVSLHAMCANFEKMTSHHEKYAKFPYHFTKLQDDFTMPVHQISVPFHQISVPLHLVAIFCIQVVGFSKQLWLLRGIGLEKFFVNGFQTSTSRLGETKLR